MAVSEMGSEEFLRRVRRWMGDSRSAPLKLASRRGNRRQGPRPVGISDREGVPERGARGDGLLDSRLLRGQVTEEDEVTRRAKLLRRARRGDEHALAELRDGLNVRTWKHKGKVLILDGLLVGAKPR